ncbi:MAG: electron transfer flavoprotein subunit beta/FixA family protein [Deltaproteobacteria bacterium]|nr:electron transfer flavoprotein subunit beta/FixA family protein [Deltaproteobacteria bacterium]MBW2345489.1 electron transfer flavoprotein subunit beta/FixA family protein [Deltaproteobacteria bacterium]
MKELRIIVCAKEIPDPEAPLSDVSVDAEKMEVIVDAPQVISPFDENALEAALRIKEDMDAKITVLSMGKKVSDTVLRKTLAAGADELILLEDEAFEKLDSNSIASVLADAIKKIGEYDLILTGRQGGDWDSGQVGLILGEMLALPSISLAREITIEDGSVLVKKSIPEGYELVRAKMPALVTVSNEVGELRYISRTKMLKMMRGAGSIPSWSAEDFGVTQETLEKMGIMALSSPPDMGRDCRFLEGTADEQAGKLAAVFKDLR